RPPTLFSFLPLPFSPPLPSLLSFPTRRSSDLVPDRVVPHVAHVQRARRIGQHLEHVVLLSSRIDLTLGESLLDPALLPLGFDCRSEEHTSELQSLRHLVCRLLLEKKKKKNTVY